MQRKLSWILAEALTFVFIFDVITCESRFITVPQSQTVIEGDSVTFTCHATPVTGLEYSWTHNGHTLENSSRVHQVGSNLHVNNVIKDVDAGDYVCIATCNTTGARQASPPATLKIIWLESVSVQLVSRHKDEIVLKCNIDGSDDLDIEWFRNSERLESIHTIRFDKNRINIHNPSPYDNGVYRCAASNSAGRMMSKKGYILKLTDAESSDTSSEYKTARGCIPRGYSKKIMKNLEKSKAFLCRGKRGDRFNDIIFAKSPPRKVVDEGDPVELPCKYTVPAKYDSSRLILRWRKDDKVIRQNDLGAATTTTSEPKMDSMIREDARLTVNVQNGSLVFTSSIASDAGSYDCMISVNGGGFATSEKIELNIIEQLKFVPQPTSKNLELGSVAKIHCKAQGTPSPQVKWYSGFSDELPSSVEDINGTLNFRNVSASHKGVYTCIASNSQGRINATIEVGVVVAPRFSVAPQGPITAIEMGSAYIHCQATGDPKPTIRWDKDLQYLSDNNTDQSRFKFFENGTLQIVEVHLEDDGKYGCTIGNSAGLKREEVRFVVKPTEGFVTEESNDGFMITRAVLITMSVAFAYIILVVGLMLWCRYRRQARKARLNLVDKENGDAGDPNNKNAEIEPCLPDKNADGNNRHKMKKVNGNNNPKGSGTEAQKSDDTISSVNSKGSKKSNSFDQLSLPRSSLVELIQIGRSDFGDVFVGKIKTAAIKISESNEKDNDEKVTTENEERKSKTSLDEIEEVKEENADEYKMVLVKALNKVKDEGVCMEFKRQIEMFRALSHKGVAKLYGLCRDKDPHYLILEYTDWGDLKQFLIATTNKSASPTGNIASMPPLTTKQILALAYQIARGMDAIYRARFIHKDLAARNCIISSDFVAKVSYPALCKDKYSREYFKHRNTLLPIRWLAPECLQEDEYTTKSDIYAFAVLVWELFTQAQKLPFEELSNEEFIKRLQSGQINWRCAENTPNDLKEILTLCWSERPKERPSFSQLCSAFSKSMQTASDT